MIIPITTSYILGIITGILANIIIIQQLKKERRYYIMSENICPCCGQVIPEPPPVESPTNILAVALKANNEGTKVPEGVLCTRTPTVTAIVTGNNNLPITYYWSWVEGSTGITKTPTTNNVPTIPVMGPIYANSMLTCKVTSNGQTISVTQKVL